VFSCHLLCLLSPATLAILNSTGRTQLNSELVLTHWHVMSSIPLESMCNIFDNQFLQFILLVIFRFPRLQVAPKPLPDFKTLLFRSYSLPLCHWSLVFSLSIVSKSGLPQSLPLNRMATSLMLPGFRSRHYMVCLIVFLCYISSLTCLVLRSLTRTLLPLLAAALYLWVYFTRLLWFDMLRSP
jgi:hypothetical protein